MSGGGSLFKSHQPISDLGKGWRNPAREERLTWLIKLFSQSLGDTGEYFISRYMVTGLSSLLPKRKIP